MALYKDEGIVIRERPLGEADKLLTILTRNKGKFSASARGRAELAIAFWTNSIVLSLAFLVFNRPRPGHSGAGEIIESFVGLRENLIALPTPATLQSLWMDF